MSSWSFPCTGPEITNDAAPNSGNWAVRVQSGNTQGCGIGYLYQLLPAVQDGDVLSLSGWAMVDPNWSGTAVGLFLGKKLPGDNFFLDNGTQTSATSWTFLNITDTFHLAPGDTAAVILNAGFVGGPSIAWAQFDGIQLDPVISTSIITVQEVHLKHYPDPVDDELFVELGGVNADRSRSDASFGVQIFDLTGRMIKDVDVEQQGDRLVLNTLRLTTGVHIARINTTKGSAVVRFAKR